MLGNDGGLYCLGNAPVSLDVPLITHAVRYDV